MTHCGCLSIVTVPGIEKRLCTATGGTVEPQIVNRQERKSSLGSKHEIQLAFTYLPTWHAAVHMVRGLCAAL